MPFGYHGRILRVDLTSSTVSIEELAEDICRKYMGGSALNLYYLLNEMSAGADPLGEDNILVLSSSAVTGAPVSGLSRMTVSAKSPLTGAIGDSQCGGTWPVKLKFSGFDAVIIKGKAPAPVYLRIYDGKAELKDASTLWGKTTVEVETALADELKDKKIEVLQIGPAGEKMVRFAAIINKCSRANGRTGMGAVMGSKNLKAVVVQGNNRPALADKESVLKLARKGAKEFPDSNVAYIGKYGTAGIVASQNAAGGLPTYNYNEGVFEQAEKLDGVTLYNDLLAGCKEGKQDSKGRETCFGCVIRCKRVVENDTGPYKLNPKYGGPEYETTSIFGSYCGISNLPAIAKANELCNKYGMDTMSCGATIAWAMEAFEAGVLTEDDTDGLVINFGDADMMLKLVEKIALQQGFGKTLGLGSAKAAKVLGKGSEFLVTCKGQELPAHMPQVKRSLALIYAVNPFGADHESSEHDPTYEEGGFAAFKDRLIPMGLNNPQSGQSLNSEKVRFARKTQYLFSLMDSLNLCQFAWGPGWQLYGPLEMVDMVTAITGWDITLDELLEVGERRLNMLREFNHREGFNRDNDVLPEKLFNELKNGPSKIWKVDRNELGTALDEYYLQNGWDQSSGNPKPETLERLGLSWVREP
jgi:aldehyde:ferredoxin oxidoreductase